MADKTKLTLNMMRIMTNYYMLDHLIDTIQRRREANPAESYVAKLLSKSTKHIAQKIAEEGAEVAIAAVSEGKEAMISESADLLFHLLILCEKEGFHFADILTELEKREGSSGIIEKNARTEG